MFDNIPLTALALKQGGYDWGMLAYAVGFGGSMIWFGSSAGVALSQHVSRRRATSGRGCATAGTWRWPTWSGFFVMLALIGFHPGSVPRGSAPAAAAAASAPSR